MVMLNSRSLADLENGSVVVFDTDCVLCSRWVHFVLAKERRPGLVFVRAWSATGRVLATRHGLDAADLHRTYLLVEKGQPLTRSAATIAILKHLRAPWRWLGLVVIVPSPIRDLLYGWVAENRYAWFGRRDGCFLPPAAARSRFIQD